ncbi:UDP-N-acetylmuramoyl-L-alanine--D-glutamate ligase [Luteimonas qiangzhengi]|uniref:UDP-N-acetylmuramoyl-L-alanine--D-glutamate ligase n=1 Tax=Luteimonas sp. MJ146 TaxID=3129240 RepID=UPI0031BB4683
MNASPPAIDRLAGQRVALWGWGREAQAAHAALRELADGPASLTLFCSPEEAAQVSVADTGLAVETVVSAERLAAFDLVVKSPGISAYRPELLEAQARGTRFVGGTALWFAARPDARTICVTGTKGKSTISAMLAHLLRAAGVRTALAGNIGMPMLELLHGQAEAWVLELSSFQTGDVAASGARPEVAVVSNIFPEHLDWHGSEERYVQDKLALVTAARPRHAVLNAADPRLSELELPDSKVIWFNHESGWHLRDQVVYRGDLAVLDAADVPLPGRHNRINLCAALAAIEAFGLDAAPLAGHAREFVPLPHRLQPLGEQAGLRWVNDSISTTPAASLAALEVYRDARVAILLGGHDRGLDWSGFADSIASHPPWAAVTMGANGPRIHSVLEPLAARTGMRLEAAADLPAAVDAARRLLGGAVGEGGGVVLLSPGAPSFGPYRDYTARGRHFAALAGFDPDAIAAIPGLGIA